MNEKKNIIYNICICIIISTLLTTNIFTGSKLIQARRESNQIRTEFNRARETVNNIDKLTKSNSNTIRESIELLKQIRIQIELLQSELNNINSSNSNNYSTDSEEY